MNVLAHSLDSGTAVAQQPSAGSRGGFGRLLLRGLTRIGQQRAAGELQRLAAYYDGFDHQLAGKLRSVATFDDGSR